jgi:hypothetical protein
MADVRALTGQKCGVTFTLTEPKTVLRNIEDERTGFYDAKEMQQKGSAILTGRNNGVI